MSTCVRNTSVLRLILLPVLAAALCAVAVAQESPMPVRPVPRQPLPLPQVGEAQQPFTQPTIIRLHNARADELVGLLTVYTGQGVSLAAYHPANAILVQAPEEILGALRQTIEELDVASAEEAEVTLNITLYAITSSSGGQAIPDVLAPVMEELRTRHGFTSASLLGSASGRCIEGRELEVSTAMSAEGPDLPAYFKLNADAPELLGPRDTRMVRFERFVASVEIPAATQTGQPNRTVVQRSDRGIATSLQVPLGEPAVISVGGSMTGAAGISALLLMVEPIEP